MSVSLYGNGNTIIQVVPSIQSIQTSTGSTTYVTTGLTATITPQSATSKILIMAQLTGVGPSNLTTGGGFAIAKNGAVVWAPSQVDVYGPYMVYGAAAGNVWMTIPLTYVDSPATTSATTYAIYFRSYDGQALYMGGAASVVTPAQHSLILMEISGS